jgi:hypothetical protein
MSQRSTDEAVPVSGEEILQGLVRQHVAKARLSVVVMRNGTLADDLYHYHLVPHRVSTAFPDPCMRVHGIGRIKPP